MTIQADASIRVGLAQLSPVLLDREATLRKVCDAIQRAADDHCRLLCFGEALVPGYPFWLGATDAARFDSALQKQYHRLYLEQAIHLPSGHLTSVQELAKRCRMGIYLGIIERAADRGGHSLYCTLVYIDANGELASSHRKLMPTYEERLSWASGDGAGLQVHELTDGFRVGGLNCWENWMPLARAALYAQGENIHVASWPGSVRNTQDITRFIAAESRSWVLSASSILSPDQLPDSFPGRDLIMENANGWLADGGSCIAGPDGSWTLEPVVGKETVELADLQLSCVLEQRQNFDPSGHYPRPDVLNLSVDRRRQSVLSTRD
jgi:nitrilase